MLMPCLSLGRKASTCRCALWKTKHLHAQFPTVAIDPSCAPAYVRVLTRGSSRSALSRKRLRAVCGGNCRTPSALPWQAVSLLHVCRMSDEVLWAERSWLGCQALQPAYHLTCSAHLTQLLSAVCRQLWDNMPASFGVLSTIFMSDGQDICEPAVVCC